MESSKQTELSTHKLRERKEYVYLIWQFTEKEIDTFKSRTAFNCRQGAVIQNLNACNFRQEMVIQQPRLISRWTNTRLSMAGVFRKLIAIKPNNTPDFLNNFEILKYQIENINHSFHSEPNSLIIIISLLKSI